MIDTRNRYRAEVQDKRVGSTTWTDYEVHYRKWYWFPGVWHFAAFADTEQEAREKAEAHASPKKPVFIDLGRLPRKPEEAA